MVTYLKVWGQKERVLFHNGDHLLLALGLPAWAPSSTPVLDGRHLACLTILKKKWMLEGQTGFLYDVGCLRSKPSQCCRFQWCWTPSVGIKQLTPKYATAGSFHPGCVKCVELETYRMPPAGGLEGSSCSAKTKVPSRRWHCANVSFNLSILSLEILGLPCIKCNQSGKKVQRFDDVELGAGYAKKNLAQPNRYLMKMKSNKIERCFGGNQP